MSIFKECLFNDGEGLDFGDLNNASRYLRSQFLDTLAMWAKVGLFDALPNPTYCWAAGNGGAPVAGGGLALGNNSGVIFQAGVGVADGTDPKFLAYYLAANEIQTTFAAADPTNSRIDLVAIKLDYVSDADVTKDFKDAVTSVVTSQTMHTSRSVRVQTAVVAGTPSASPLMPLAPAGYVPWAALLIPAGATSALATNVYDHRMPVGLKSYDIIGNQMSPDVSGGVDRWALTSFGGRNSDAINALTTQAIAPASWGRIVAVGLSSDNGNHSAQTAKLWQVNLVNGGNLNQIVDLSAFLVPAHSGPIYQETSFLIAPIWCDGTAAQYANQSNLSSALNPRAALRYVSNSTTHNDTVYAARFLIAG